MSESMHGKERSKSIVLVHRTKPREIIYPRSYPKTALDPTYPQILCRIAFGEAGLKAKGIKYKGKKDEYPIPPAAKFVQEELSGRYFGRTKKIPKWMEKLSKEYNVDLEFLRRMARILLLAI